MEHFVAQRWSVRSLKAGRVLSWKEGVWGSVGTRDSREAPERIWEVQPRSPWRSQYWPWPQRIAVEFLTVLMGNPHLWLSWISLYDSWTNPEERGEDRWVNEPREVSEAFLFYSTKWMLLAEDGSGSTSRLVEALPTYGQGEAGMRLWAQKVRQGSEPPEQHICCCCSAPKSCPSLCDPMDCSTPGSSVRHYLLKFAQICVHSDCDVMQPSVTPFSSYPQSFPASGSFPISPLFASGGQSIGASVSTSVLLMNIQGWFPLRLTGLISLLSNGLSRVFSGTTIRKHPFLGAQLCLWPSSLIPTWYLEKL